MRRTPRTTRPSTRSSSRSASDARARGRDRCGLVALVGAARRRGARSAAATDPARPAGDPRRLDPRRRRLRGVAAGADRRPPCVPSTRSPAGLTRVDRRVDAAVTNTSVVRYDAYEDAGGQQSASFAFLDCDADGHRRDRDPGPRLRPGVRQGARSRQPFGRALARGGRGSRARHGSLAALLPGGRSARVVACTAGGCGSWVSGAFRAVRPGKRPATLAQRASGPRPERELRAAERVLGTPGARARLARARQRSSSSHDEPLRTATRDVSPPARHPPASRTSGCPAR